jgi:hypothetical protein
MVRLSPAAPAPPSPNRGSQCALQGLLRELLPASSRIAPPSPRSRELLPPEPAPLSFIAGCCLGPRAPFDHRWPPPSSVQPPRASPGHCSRDLPPRSGCPLPPSSGAGCSPAHAHPCGTAPLAGMEWREGRDVRPVWGARRGPGG